MNKKVLRFLAILLVLMMLTLAMVGCGTTTEPDTTPDETPTATDEKLEMMLGTATSSGFTYIWGAAAAEIINKYVPNIHVTAQITTGGGENMVRIVDGQMPMGIAGNNIVQKFYDGCQEEKIVENKNIRTIWVSKSTVFSAIVHKDSPYQTLEDLKGKRVSIGNKGGSAYDSISTFLDALNIGGDYFDLQFLTMSESLDAMKTKNIDAFFTNTSDPHTAMTEVFLMPGGARFLDFPQEKIDTLLEKVPYLSPAVRAAGTYHGQDKEVISVGSPYALVVTEDFPEDLAYEIAKALDENYNEWVGIAANVEGSTLEATVKYSYAPLHKGVEKYAKEKGML